MKSKKDRHPASTHKTAGKKQKNINRKGEGETSLQDHARSQHNDFPKDIDAERHPEEQVVRE